MKKIYYLGYYDTIDNTFENRNFVLSASNKMSYIIDAIEKAGFSVYLISASATRNAQHYNEKSVSVGKNSTLHLFKTLPWGNKIRRIISVLYTAYQYRRFILKNLTSNDTLIAYHSVSYSKFLARAKKKIGFRLILEVEEIYADVSGSLKDKISERSAFNSADMYIFPTKLLDEKLNKNKKPSVIIHGTYNVENKLTETINDGKIHIVYAGTFDPRKGGAIASVRAGLFLDNKYHIHILGFGNDVDKQILLLEIEKISKISDCTITYDGMLSGDDYIKFIQSCHIGLSTQNPTAKFNDTSFPSKILSYMANGLRVVSIKIPVIETSDINEYMFYYEEPTPEKIAQTIKNIDLSEPYDGQEFISELNTKFVVDIADMLSE